MSSLENASYEWVFISPRDTLQNGSFENLPRPEIRIVLFSSLLSYALAKTLLAMPAQPSFRGMSPVSLLIFNFCLQSFMVLFALGMTHQIVRLIKSAALPFRGWMTLGSVALLPLHLTLPLALLSRPFGTSGSLIYSLGELTLWIVIIRRWTSGVETLLSWPPWAALLLVLSPLFLGYFSLLMGTILIIVCLVFIFLGFLV